MNVIYFEKYNKQKKKHKYSKKRKNIMDLMQKELKIDIPPKAPLTTGQIEDSVDISYDQKLYIEKIVADILHKSNIEKPAEESSLIVDIVRLVKSYDFAVQSAEMDKDTTGILIVNENDTVLDTNKNRLIIVNTNFDNPNNDENVVLKKSRFITAHEYGHYVLHKKPGQPIYAHRDTTHRTEPEELEADYFARAILMPLNTFRVYVKVMKDLNLFRDEEMCISILSKIFKTTKNKVAKRLKDLEEMEVQ